MSIRLLFVVVAGLFFMTEARADQFLGYVTDAGDYVGANGSVVKVRQLVLSSGRGGGAQVLYLRYTEDERYPANRSVDRLLTLPIGTRAEVYITCAGAVPHPGVYLSNVPGGSSCYLGAYYTHP